MKSIQTLFWTLLLLWITPLQAQIYISGTVTDSTGTPLPNFEVHALTASGSFSNPAMTDANGFYEINLTTSLPAGFQDSVLVSWLSCLNPSQLQFAYAGAAGNGDSLSFDFQCDSTYLLNSGGCDASYSFLMNGDTAFFTPTSPISATASYFWDFGNGSTSTQYDPSTIYSSPGTYQVCLTITDSINNCFADFCFFLTIGNAPTCNAFFYSVPLGNNEVQFFSNGTSGLTYEWDFGDGNTSSDPSPRHIYTNAGIYNVCLTVKDSLTSCVDSFCSIVNTGTSNPCSADFFVGYDSTFNSLYFEAMNPSSNLDYFWDLGDGNTASGAFVSHNYATAGTYQVCLTVSDSANACSDSACAVISTLPPQNNFAVIGTAYASGLPALDFTAWLIVEDSIAGTLTAVDTFKSDSSTGPFFFFGAPNGDYMVKVALNSTSPDYANYLPTYYGDDISWSNSTVVNQNSFPFIEINLVPGSNPGGPGFVGGLISQGANRTSSNMVEGLTVLLQDQNGNTLRSAITNASGEYSFDNLAMGTYKVWVDFWGRSSEVYEIELNGNNMDAIELNFEMNDTQILKTSSATSLNEIAELDINLYPNPAKQTFQLEISMQEQGQHQLNLMNSMGQLLKQVELKNGQQSISVQELPEGIYIARITKNGKLVIDKKLTIQR